jgi:hypothetical protein
MCPRAVTGVKGSVGTRSGEGASDRPITTRRGSTQETLADEGAHADDADE